MGASTGRSNFAVSRERTAFFKISFEEVRSILEQESLLSSETSQKAREGRMFDITATTHPAVKYIFIPVEREDKYFLQISCPASIRDLMEMLPETIRTILNNRSPLTFYHCMRPDD